MFISGKCNLCNGPIIKINSTQFGQRCIFCRSTPIHRALGLAFADIRGRGALPADAAVYEMSSRGAFFNYLSKQYKNLQYSEYYDDVEPGAYKAGVQCQDVQRLTFGDASFDVVTSTEVFEHVPDDIKGYREVYRVLKPGGHLVFTVPLADTDKTVERAVLKEDGSIEHLLPPEYHGDRIRGSNGVLAFRTYGADIVDRLNSVGFSASIERYNSRKEKVSNNAVVIALKG